jgi:type IV secretory pathway ATPase VirB11/archaellum biosynthesis ATPase
MQTRAARADRPAVDLRRLVAGFLRMAPDVAVVGEVRDREALPELLSYVATTLNPSRRRPGSPLSSSAMASGAAWS